MNPPATSGAFALELAKTAIGPVLTVGLAWLVGYRLTTFWNIRQKLAELNLAAATQFYQLYGEFFAVWKLWNYLKGQRGMPILVKSADEARWDLLQRACSAEAGVEAILVKLAIDPSLTNSDIEDLGRFRQAYQSLRQAIRDDTPISWNSSSAPEYRTFKALACKVACILTSATSKDMTTAQQTLDTITSNRWEHRWVMSFQDTIKRTAVP
jgi:hypothetical protein